MINNTMNDGTWRKAKASAHNGGCVEVRRNESGGVDIRDTKNRDLAAHSYTAKEWGAFLDGAKKGEFDL
jgi:hypothetical protein